MSKHPIKENSFDGAPGGTSGTLGYQTPYGTPSGLDNSQNPGAFDSSNKNKSLGNKGNTTSDLPRTGSIGRDLDQLYAKKDTPTPDEVISGIKYEMGQQIKKDKAEAKQLVLQNLRKDSKFYSGMKMLGITDKDMVDNMTESKHPNDAPARPKVTPNIEETKKIFAEMAKGLEKKYVVNSQICDVMKEMWAAKTQRSAWKTK
jgi:hypothetical protein